jgi:hypothetical protein
MFVPQFISPLAIIYNLYLRINYKWNDKYLLYTAIL